MKKALVLATAMLFVASTAMAQGISGTAHDFSGAAWNATAGEICNVCHTPHNGDATVTDAPLWDHEVTTATFTVYASGTLDATVGQPGGASKLCLSCHDGSVALDSFGGATGATNLTGDALVGTDLSNDHPISFTYNTALATADGELEDPATVTAVSDLLFSGQMQCASCHDVHDDTHGMFLVMDNAASALCLTCHAK